VSDMHKDKGHHDGKGDSGEDDEAAGDIGQEEEDNDNSYYSSENSHLLKLKDRILDKRRGIKDGPYLYILGQILFYLSEFLMNPIGNSDRVSSRLLTYD